MPGVMNRLLRAAVICGSWAATMPALGEDRPADVILKEIDALKTPEVDQAREEDPAYIREFMKQRADVRVRRADLIGKLSRIDPDNPRLVKLLPVRWRAYSGMLGGPDAGAEFRDLSGEMDEVIAGPRSPELKKEAVYTRAWIASDFRDRPGSVKGFEAKAKAVDEFIAYAPKDPRGAELLYLLTLPPEAEPARKALFERIVSDYPETRQAEKVRGILRQLEAVGKPVDLAFTDAIGGHEVSIRGLKGKVVVLDFWATWCGPCVADMPEMKQLYAKFHNKGVEFIGVSLDVSKEEGGLDALKAFVAKNEIPWPQYYQGNGWEGEFSMRWGVQAIPDVFVVDQDGKIASLGARGQLEVLIPELLHRKKSKTDQ